MSSSSGRRRQAHYNEGRRDALTRLGLVHRQEDNPVVQSYIDNLPGAKTDKRQVSAGTGVLNRMGEFGPKLDLTSSNLPASM